MGQEDDLHARARDFETMQVAVGHVGWDTGEHIMAGNPDGPDGERHTLVHVTLGGKNQSQLSTTNKGRKLVCAISDLLFSIPPVGTLVYVAIPHGMDESPGAAMIIAARRDDPDRLATDRVVMNYPGKHVLIVGKSVAIQSDAGEFVSVGEPRSGGTSGVTIQAQDGSGAVWQVGVASMFVASDGDAKSVLQLTPDRAELMHKTSGFMRLGNGEIVALSKGKASYLAGATLIGTGVPSLPPGGVAFGATPTPTLSATVFVSN